MKGIPIHTISLNKIKSTRFFSLIENQAFQQIFSKPQRIVNSHATAKKEPIKVVNAPKDTAEYNASSTTANTNYDTTALQLTFMEYETNMGFRMVFIPLEERNFHNRLTDFGFNTKLNWRNFKSGFISSLQFRVPDYYPTVKIYLPQEDILSMHRALPENAEVCVHY
jgi:L-arabinose isomerase